MASAGLLHPQVNVDLDAVEDEIIMRGEYRPDANDQSQPLHTVKGRTSLISEVWPEPPPHGHLHVFVGRPGVVDSPTSSSEWFFSLLLFGPFGNAISLFGPVRPPKYVSYHILSRPKRPSLGVPFDKLRPGSRSIGSILCLTLARTLSLSYSSLNNYLHFLRGCTVACRTSTRKRSRASYTVSYNV